MLLTEGSSLTSREVVTCLGPAGYHLEVLDPGAVCLTRFSRWVHRVHRSPAGGADPLGYLRRLADVVAERAIDVVLPTHEQAWLLAAGQALLPRPVPVAVARAGAFARVQSKLAFAQLLDELGLPQPRWREVKRNTDLSDLQFPYWLKAAFSTAGRGVIEVADVGSREQALRALFDGETGPVMAQQAVRGQYGQVQGLFDRGRLVAVHTSVRTGVGIGGSAAARLSADHPAARDHIASLGEALRWHGGLTLDYIHQAGLPTFIECNPRTVEPGNATASGVNIPDLEVRLTLGEELPARPRHGRPGVRTHGMIALALGAATASGSRSSVLAQMRDAVAHRGTYADSGEQLTPVIRDPPSTLALAFVLARLLQSPQRAAGLAARTVAAYSVGPDAVERLRALPPRLDLLRAD